VIQDDVLLYENSFNGSNRDSINTFFSMAKSTDSALIRIAIDEGYIKNVDEPDDYFCIKGIGKTSKSSPNIGS
jgi:hypothetical protein